MQTAVHACALCSILLLSFCCTAFGASKAQTSSDEPKGRWHTIDPDRAGGALTAEQQEAARQLESIGYLAGSKQAPDLVGVTVYHKKLAQKGLNLYVSGHAPEAILMDMEGRELHKWRYSFKQVWPDRKPGDGSDHEYWRRAYLFDNGDLLAIFEGFGMIKLDKDSKLKWVFSGNALHDLFLTADGSIYTLTRKARIVPRYNKSEPILEDYISILGSDGKEKKRVSILKSLENSRFRKYVRKMSRKGDVLHTNTIEVLDGRWAERDPAFKAGNVLISILHLDLICVVDLEAERVVWAASGSWKRQHQPAVLDNGRLLLFDNKGLKTATRVMEIDPIDLKVAWEYRGTAANPFFSYDCGSSERLKNGNTLITESNTGRAFEVTLDKEIVWEFFSPQRAGENNELIATLFEVVRLDADFPLDWLD